MVESRQLGVEDTLRRLLLILFAVAVTGVGAELLLLGHTEQWQQWIPLIFFVVCLLAVLGQVSRPGRVSVLVLRWVAGCCVASGVLGLYLHYRGNVEFELEMYPSRRGWELFREAMTGATPALAPGTMIMLGFLGIVYTFRHPLLASRRPGTSDDTGDTL